jgi:hypothetical protein
MNLESAAARCLVVRGFDAHGRPVLCLKAATVEIYGRPTRRREVCVGCANRLFDFHYDRGGLLSMRALPSMMKELLD